MDKFEDGPAEPDRRQAFKRAGAGVAAALGASALVPSAPAKTLPPGPATTPFVQPLTVYGQKLATPTLSPYPDTVPGEGECGREVHQRYEDFYPQRFYDVRVREALHSFHPELPTQKVWGYDGLVPGPTFVAYYGEPILVRFYNELPANAVGFGSPEISTHLHNLHSPSESDGFAGNYYSGTKFGPTLTGPGYYQDHCYPNCYAGYDGREDTFGDPREALGTLWYHDHRMDFTAPNVYKGMAGFYLLFDELDSGNEQDPNPNALRLPSGVGAYDIPLMIHDKQFDSGGYLYYDELEQDGFLGNKFCVNGKIQPFFKVERRKYRFRLLDAGPSRFYELYLTYNNTNQTFSYIANDGNLLPAPLTMNKVALGVAERGDIVVDFSRYPIGAQLFLVNRLKQTNGRGPDGVAGNPRAANGDLLNAGDKILRFDVAREPAQPDLSRVPATLRELPPLNLAAVTQTRQWDMDRQNNVWKINNQIFDVERPAATIKRGSTEIWILKGKGGWSHPLHIHMEEGRILTRNGLPPPPHERGRKDVYVIGPNDELRLLIRFRDFTGKYMLHCHNVVHEDHAMMARFDIVP